jgi:hypothetical protein
MTRHSWIPSLASVWIALALCFAIGFTIDAVIASSV